MLESLAARFVHPGIRQLTVLPFFNTSQNIRIMKAKKLLNFFK